MSKIGRKSISLEGVEVVVDGKKIEYKGAFAKGTYLVPEVFEISVKDKLLYLHLSKTADKRKHNKFWGLHRSLLANYIAGARKPFEVSLLLVGLGYKAELKGSQIVFALGYSHKIDFDVPDSVSVKIEKNGQKIILSSFDKFLVGDVAQKIRKLRAPEPYKGKGIRYEDEYIIKKVGKKAKG